MSKNLDRAKKIKSYYEKTFSSDEGEKVLHDLIKATGIMGPSLDLKNPDPMVSAFNDGAKSIVHRIIQMVEMDPKKYIEVLGQQGQQEDFEL